MLHKSYMIRGTAHGRITWQTIITHHCSCSGGFRRLMPFFVRVTCFCARIKKSDSPASNKTQSVSPTPELTFLFHSVVKSGWYQLDRGVTGYSEGKPPGVLDGQLAFYRRHMHAHSPFQGFRCSIFMRLEPAASKKGIGINKK